MAKRARRTHNPAFKAKVRHYVANATAVVIQSAKTEVCAET